MTLPEFSVLLLAWDDADPSVAVFGGAALPPTLPLVYQLAAQQPVLAVYPHLPFGEHAASGTPNNTDEAAPDITPAARPAAATTDTEATEVANEANDAIAPEETKSALDTEVALPGVQLLPSPATESGKVPATAETAFSRIIGLEDLTPASSPAAAAESVAAATTAGATAKDPEKVAAAEAVAAPVAVSARSQWPAGTVLSQRWLAPAAPYLGAGSVETFPLPPPAPPRPSATSPETQEAVSLIQKPQAIAEEVAVAEAAIEPASDVPQAASVSSVALRRKEHPLAGDLNFDPDPELPAMLQLPAFDEPIEEVGTAEAYDISAPEDDITLDTSVTPVAERVVTVFPTVAARPATPPVATPAMEIATPIVLMPRMDGLNFRMIQYARQAAQLVRGRSDIAIIYAPNWPAWLAALELRDSTRKPLVLYVANLAADFAAPAERGWLLEIERMTLRRATLILVPDQATEKQLRKHYADTIGAGRVAVAANEATVQQHLTELALASI